MQKLLDICIRITALVFFACFPLGTQAHDPRTHQSNDLASAKSKAGTVCCDGKDYTIPSNWERTADGFRVLIGDKWLNVPKDAVVTNMTNPDIEAKVWLFEYGSYMNVRCFMPGAEI